MIVKNEDIEKDLSKCYSNLSDKRNSLRILFIMIIGTTFL